MQLEEIATRNRATRQMQRFLCFFSAETRHPVFHSLRQYKRLNIKKKSAIESIGAPLNPSSTNVKSLLEPMKFFLRERLLQSYMLVD
jgi:hypothetical protein